MLDVKALLNKLTMHINNAGDVYEMNGTKTNMSSGSSIQTLITKSNIPAGTWLAYVQARYPNNATGLRSVEVGWRLNPDGTIKNIGASRYAIPGTSSGISTHIESMAVVVASAPWDLMVRGNQNSGGTMDVPCYLKAIRIK